MNSNGASVIFLLSRFMAEPNAKRVVTALYVVLMGCVFAFLAMMIVLNGAMPRT